MIQTPLASGSHGSWLLLQASGSYRLQWVVDQGQSMLDTLRTVMSRELKLFKGETW